MAILEGHISGNKAEVDSLKNLKVNLPTGTTEAGYASIIVENDGGLLSGNKTLRSPYVTMENRLLVGLDTPLVDYTFNSTLQDTGVWRYVTATMTTTWTTSGMLLNAISTLTNATGTAVSSWKTITLNGNGSFWLDNTINITALPLANQVAEFGLFPFGAGNVAPTEGVYFRLTNAGLVGIINFNGTETTTSPMLLASEITPNQSYVFSIKVNERSVSYWLNGNLLSGGTLTIPAAQGQPYITTALPQTYQVRNSGTVSGAPVMQVKVLDTSVDQKSINLGKPFSHIQAAKGAMSSQGQNGGTMGSTALYSNSLGAGAGAAIANATAAAGFLGLGGQFSVQPTLTVGTDGILCSYQVPVGSINQTPRTLYITGVRIQSVVTTVLVGGPVLYAYSLAYGHNLVSLANGEGIAAKAPRRVPLGIESIAATAAVGTIGGGVYMPFNSPIVVNPGEFVAIAAKNLGVVTSAGVVVILVTFDGYYE
jgi:hypothetical protein